MKKFANGILLLAIAVSAVPAFAAITIKVPEPATFGLLVSGLAGIAFLRRIRNQ